MQTARVCVQQLNDLLAVVLASCITGLGSGRHVAGLPNGNEACVLVRCAPAQTLLLAACAAFDGPWAELRAVVCLR